MATGVVLAGGLGRRMGGPSKPGVELGGRPLIAWPLAALSRICSPVAVVGKARTRLPPLPAGVERWDEPDEPRHPLVGLVHALERAAGAGAGRAPLTCPSSRVTVLQALITEGEGAADPVAAVAFAGGRVEPLLGLYRPSALPILRGAAPDARLTTVVEALDPVLVPVPGEVARSVNTPAELRAAETRLSA